jgi:serine/threonine-protein kinase HipA
MRDALAGVFADAAPDSWGRRLLERAYGNGLSEFEYLTLSDDACRQGALRFQGDDGEIIRGKAGDAVPRLVELEAITAIARAYEQGKEISAEEMQALAGAGGSGGARPKANVQDGDTLWLAKFTSVHDQQPIERVEVATLRLAQACGIRTPTARLELADTLSGRADPAVRPARQFPIPISRRARPLGRPGRSWALIPRSSILSGPMAPIPKPISASFSCA